MASLPIRQRTCNDGRLVRLVGLGLILFGGVALRHARHVSALVVHRPNVAHGELQAAAARLRRKRI